MHSEITSRAAERLSRLRSWGLSMPGRRAAVFLVLVIGSQWTCAQPYIPKSGAEVLERLPSRNDPAEKKLRLIRAELAVNPRNLSVAVELSRLYISMWRDGGDPRYLGYAQAALMPWWNLAQPPVAAQVMRATLLQSMHRFSAALVDLDAILKADGANAQAWLTRATVLQVLGRYAEARASCRHLYSIAPPLIAVTCTSSVDNLNGKALASYTALKDALSRHPNASANIRIWVSTLLAEMAVRGDDYAAARMHFEQALASGKPDNYLLAAYADFLLEQHQPAKVVVLLQKKTRIDTLLLRYALALKALHSPDAQKNIEMLNERFDAAKMRGDTIHRRAQARFELELLNRPAEALKVAQQNWNTQKEPADTLLLLEAAAAANNADAAAPVIKWIKKSGLEDHELSPFLKKFGASKE